MDATESGIKTEEKKKKRTEEDLTKNNLASNLLKSSEMPFFLEKMLCHCHLSIFNLI